MTIGVIIICICFNIIIQNGNVRWKSLFFIFAFVWIMVLVTNLFNYYQLNVVSDQFYKMVFLGVTFWMIGYFLLRMSRFVLFKNLKNRRETIEYYVDKKLTYVYICIILIFSALILSIEITYLSNGFTYAQFHKLAFGDYEERMFTSSFLNQFYNKIMYPILLAILPVFAVFVFNKKERRMVILGVLAVFIYCLLIGRRFPLLYLIIDGLLAMELYRISIPKKWLKKFKLIVLVLLVLIILITAWRKKVFETGKWSEVFRTFYLYFQLCLPVGDYWFQSINQNQSITYGRGFFKGIIDSIDFITRQFGFRFLYNESFQQLYNMPQANYINIGSGQRANAFCTWIYFFYFDLREFGVVVGSFIFGAVTGYLERMVIKFPDLKKNLIYLLFSQCVLKSFVRWEFSVSSYVLSFFFLLLLIRKKNDTR